MATALVLSVGTTSEPLKKAVDEVAGEGDVCVYLIYGRPFSGQYPNPFEIAQEVCEYVRGKGIRVEPREVPEPEDFEESLKVARQILGEVKNYERIIVNYTGGTKAMSAALVHASLTSPLAGELELHYVGGQVRDKNGRVIREAMETRKQTRTLTHERMRLVLEAIGQYRYEIANNLAELLPDVGKAGFVKRVSRFLLKWDSFDYEGAWHELRQIANQASALLDDREVGKVAETVRRFLSVTNLIVELVRKLRKLMQSGEGEGTPNLENFALLCADVLENAERCRAKKQFNEAVLRSYRALEVAIQGALLKEGINPWCPDWERIGDDLKEKLEGQFGKLPQELALWTGLVTWKVLTGEVLSESEEKFLKDLQNTRNRCILEHGYYSCDERDAERCISYAQSLCERVLGLELKEFRETVRL